MGAIASTLSIGIQIEATLRQAASVIPLHLPSFKSLRAGDVSRSQHCVWCHLYNSLCRSRPGGGNQVGSPLALYTPVQEASSASLEASKELGLLGGD